MILSFHPCFVADYQIILGDRSLDSDDVDLIREARVIILPQACPFDLYRACKSGSALLFPNYDARFDYPGKIGQTTLFEKLKCPHPKTLIWYGVDSFSNARGKTNEFPHRTPFLLKTNEGHEAAGLFLIRSRKDLESALVKLESMERSGSWGFVSQDLIPCEGNTLRAVIMGNRIITYWKRPERPGDIITTISRGAKIDREWRPDLQEKAEREARGFSMATGINLAAIDFVFDLNASDPEAFFLEINYYFGRKGLGGSKEYYRLLHLTIRDWLKERGIHPDAVRLV
ncbi:MAG: hypothetical protein JRJ03_10430 [Deltaproteobacteria bacterium]|nr:hypothetical protein [Deltaproteobacteria bacterium]